MGSPNPIDDNEFAEAIEKIVIAALPKRLHNNLYEWELDDLVGPIAEEIVRLCNISGQQDPSAPGKIRIDAGRPLSYGGLKPNEDAVIVIDFALFEELGSGGFHARYNLADELMRYAENGEAGWDVARQIQQLEKTIVRLRLEAEQKGWSLPDVPTHSDRTDILDV